MKNILIISVLMLSCNNIADKRITSNFFKVIDYTYDSGWKVSYSLKINSDGMCIVGDGRWEMKFYTGKLTKVNIQSIDSLLQNIPFNKYDSSYHEHVADQASYKFVVINNNKDTITKFVYGRTAPKLLNDFSNRLRQIKEELHLVSKDTAVDFASRINFFPPTN